MASNNVILKDIFTDQKAFEKHVLDVYTDADREEIANILAERIIKILLKEELNFLYIKDFDNFRFSLIVNILFKEFTNEWVSYAQENLLFSHEAAVEQIQDRKNVTFLLAIVKWYFKTYKIYFAQEIADTFIELVDRMPHATLNNNIIEIIIESDFLKKGNISILHSYNQLWTRVKSAHNIKNEQLSNIQIKIHEAIEIEDKDKLAKLEYEVALLEIKSLAYFDDSVMRVKNTMVEYMLGIDYFKS